MDFVVWFVFYGLFCFGLGYLASAFMVERERRKQQEEKEQWKSKLYPRKAVPRG